MELTSASLFSPPVLGARSSSGCYAYASPPNGSTRRVGNGVTPNRPQTLWGLVVLWLFTALLGSILGPIGFLGVVDPVGSKHADDNDPFGPPGGRVYPAVVMLVGIALVLWAVVPLARPRHPESLHSEQGRDDHPR
jgi:hypothetical protein